MSLWDFIKNSAKGGMIPAAFGLFDRDDPQKQANRYLDQIPGVGGKYYNPFIDRGGRAGNTLENEYGRMLNPTSFIDDIMKNYTESQGAQYQKRELGRGIGATAAAGGFAGTPEHQKEYATMANDVMSKDMQTYLQNALGVYGAGLTGEQDFFGKGYDASGKMADLLSGNLGSQAGLAFQNASQNNASRDAFMMALMKALSQGAGAGAGGGF